MTDSPVEQAAPTEKVSATLPVAVPTPVAAVEEPPTTDYRAHIHDWAAERATRGAVEMLMHFVATEEARGHVHDTFSAFERGLKALADAPAS